jgi:ferrous iron transport protein B
MSDCHDCGSSVSVLPPAAASKGAAPAVIAIIGPPNSGKSTLFNRLTGLRQKVANFPGVTVEQRTGRVKLANGREAHLIDLPGLYSLAARSEDEQITHDVLKGLRPGIPRPDAVILILDSTNLGRHLLLAAPILAEGLPTLIALNMADDLKGRGGSVDVDKLSEQLGAPVALISASRGEGIEAVMKFLNRAATRKTPLLVLPVLNDIPGCRRWAARAGEGAGYHAPAPPRWTRRLDAVFLHPLAGPLIFLLVVIAVFTSVFKGAKPLMNGLQAAVIWSGNAIAAQLPDSMFRSLLTEGVWRGVGAVIIFLPQILILFLFIGILEDSGYLARAAVIADRTMARVGLQGKSFIPLLSAYGCAVPAIMATRTIESKRDRIATILIAPFMTCSARLPIYILIIAAFIPDRAQVAA